MQTQTDLIRPANDHSTQPPVAGDERYQQFHAEVDRVTFRNDENGWTVLKVRDVETNDIVTVTGSLPPVQEGEHLQLVGQWTNHATFGKQFKAERGVPTRPTTRAGILRYVSSGLIKGIGDRTAEKIVDHFGLDTFKILDENPGCLLQVPKIGKKKAKEIIEGWKSQKAVADVMMFLINHGISANYAQRILKLYGENAIEIISGNPYQLSVDVHGIGFIKADMIARSIGIAADSPERIRAGIVYQLQQAEERGHCFCTTMQLTESLADTLDLSVQKIETAVPQQIELLNQAGSLVTETNTIDGNKTLTHWRPELLAAEYGIADVIARLMSRPLEVDGDRIEAWISRYNQAASAPLSETQSKAVRAAVSNRVFILTGGPGVGKTTTANSIIRLFKAMGKTVLLSAPTGRAAQRLSEVSAEKAKTIHRLLEWQPAESAFGRNALNPLAADVIICDEASMLDVKLAEALCEAVAPQSQLVFIGDVDQLPSVGPGNVLRDMIQSDVVPFVTLKEIFRQAATSSIIRHAHAINAGVVPEFPTDVPTDCQFIEVDSTEDIRVVIRKLLTETLPQKYNVHPKRDIQILTPMNRGDLGTQLLNEELQELLNPDPKRHMNEAEPKTKRGRAILRVGDKVIQTSNNYELQVFNGDIGFVQSANVDGGHLIVQFGDDRVVTYDIQQADDLRLAYTITIHKSQGSEFPVVLLPMSMQHYVMLQRNLVYTALTRAKKLAIFIGARKALSHAIRNNVSINRQTQLKERLIKAVTES